VCALLVAGLVVTARALAAPQGAVLGRGFGVSAIVYWIAYNIWWNRHELNPASGLPLQICELNGLVAPLALLTGKHWLRATLYFWNFALTLQAFIQPTLTHGPASPVFWFFWAAHSIVVASAAYDIAGLGFRPQWRDLGRAYAVSAPAAAADQRTCDDQASRPPQPRSHCPPEESAPYRRTAEWSRLVQSVTRPSAPKPR
jgi:hypothetical integral membrane protein (TIGR02206 family)